MGHVAHMTSLRTAYKIIIGKSGDKRPRRISSADGRMILK